MAEVAEADKVVLVKVADEHKDVDPDDKYVELADHITFEVALLLAENDKVEVACLRIDVLAVESLVDVTMEVNKLVAVEVAHGPKAGLSPALLCCSIEQHFCQIEQHFSPKTLGFGFPQRPLRQHFSPKTLGFGFPQRPLEQHFPQMSNTPGGW